MKQVGSDYDRDQVAPILQIAVAKTINKKFSVIGNWGMSYDGLTPVPNYSYVLSVSQSLGSRWGSVYEVYGNEAAEVRSTYLGVGLGYLLHDNLQLDSYISSGNNEGIKEFYFTLGVSWRTQLFEPGA